MKRLLEHEAWPFVCAAISVVLMLPAIGSGFALDDHFQRHRLLGFGEPSIHLFEFYDGDPEKNRELRERGVLPWWSAEDLRHKNFRYLSVLTMQLDYLVWPGSPAAMHVHSLLWLALLVVACALLYRRTLHPGWVAGLATLLYALEDAHAAPAAYLANRNALIATSLGVLSLLCLARSREEGWRPGVLLSPLLLLAALFAAEIALGTLAYLAAYVLFIERAPWLDRVKALSPHLGVLLLWGCLYVGFGFGAKGSGFYNDPLGDPLTFIPTALERIPILLLGQWTVIPADFSLASDPTQNPKELMIALGLGLVGVLAALFLPLLLRDRAARFFCAGSLFSLAPIAATGPQNRLLFFVGIGAMALVALLVHAALEPERLLRRRLWLWPARVFAVLMVLTHLILAPMVGWLSLEAQDQANERLRSALDSVPDGAALARQDLVLVNPPDYTYTVGAIPVAKRVEGASAPRSLRALSVGSSPVAVTRVDERTLDVEIEYGLFSTPISRYFRAESRGIDPGDRFSVSGLEVQVRRVKEGRGPDVIRYRFDTPLEDASLRWLVWKERRYEEWFVPAVGERVELAPAKGIFDP